MKEDDHFLVGQRFSVAGEVYVVRALASDADQIRVTAHRPCLEPQCVDATCEHETRDARTFLLADVINGLLVEEEIVLFYPNYLAAR